MIDTIFRAVDRIEAAIEKVEPVSLRDQFDTAALQGIIANASTHKQIIEQGNGLDTICSVTAKAAYSYADAMFAAREWK